MNDGNVKKLLRNYNTLDEILPSVQDFLNSLVVVNELRNEANFDDQPSVQDFLPYKCSFTK